MSLPIRLPTLLLVGVSTLACERPVAPDADPPVVWTQDSVVVVRGAHLLTMGEAGTLRDHSVVVRDGVIAEVGPADEVAVPPGAQVFDGTGRWLVPGLVDSHVHLDPAELEAYLVHGVTTVRNMWGWPGLKQIMEAVESGELLGPTIHSYSSGLDAPPEYWPWTQVVTTSEEGRAAVRQQVAEGWMGIKVYRDLSRASFDAIVDEARAAGIPVVGHAPVAVGIEGVLEAELLSVEHLLGYGQALGGGYGAWTGPFDETGMRELARRTRAAGTWNCPTLEILRRGGRPGHQNRLQALRVLFEEGAELVVGTDSGIDVTEPGASMVREMLLWQEAGIPPSEILRDATADAARLLGREGEFGVIVPGARADLVLLWDDPTEDVAALGDRVGVMVRGRWMDPG